jgi:hypothetical protein
MPNLSDLTGGINPRPAYFFDRLIFVVEGEFSERDREHLNKNSRSMVIEPNEWPRDWETILKIVCPNERALRLLTSLPNLPLRSGEVALDLVVQSQADAWRLHRIGDNHFVRPWHGDQVMKHFKDTTYIGTDNVPGRSFGWYSDRPSKWTGDPHCLHIEVRHIGVPALRQSGITDKRDLLTFDHVAFWRKHLRLHQVDLARLGRWHDNKVTGKRRQRVETSRIGSYTYKKDRALGSFLFRRHGQHEKEGYISTDRFIQTYGHGRFASPIDVSSIFGDHPLIMSDDTVNPTGDGSGHVKGGGPHGDDYGHRPDPIHDVNGSVDLIISTNTTNETLSY